MLGRLDCFAGQGIVMEFRLLGPVGVWVNGQPVRMGGRRERTMLAVLLLATGRLVPNEKIIDAVWGDSPPVTARRQVHNATSELRRVLGPLLVTREPGYLLAVEPASVDLRVFETGVASARQEIAAGRLAEAAAAFRAALRLWRGPALSGVNGLAGEAAQLDEQRLSVLAERIEAELATGRHADLVRELSGLVEEHPLRERFAAQLMLALYRCGRVSEALRVYQQARRALAEGLGLEPRGELRRLETAMLAGDPRLELTPVTPVTAAPCLLPADVADFTGRGAEVDLLCAALGEADRAAVVVSAVAGRGGVGKTALAVHVAHRLRESFPDGQLYVNLHGGQTEPGEVLGRFLRGLGVDGTAIPQDIDERAELYRARLAGRKVLVLLDNAGDEAQVQPLLPGSASSAVLVTSRARLGGLAGVRLVELDVLDREQALLLLGRIAGAARVSAERSAAAELVGLCGQLPLAVRIAGARLASRPHWLIADLVGRLSDERHRLDELSHGGLAVRASLELSFRGLAADARMLFRRLGLLDAPDFAGWVCAALLDIPVARGEELAERLVDARLLEVVGRDACGLTRFRFHDLVRGYARERAELEESAPDRRAALARAFGAWLALAEGAHRRVYGGHYVIIHGTAPRWPGVAAEHDPLTWMETERLGIVASVRQAAELELDELAWDLGGSCVALYATRWYLDDWQQVIDDALAVTRRRGNRRGEAATLYCQAALHDANGNYEPAMSVLASARELFEQTGERHGLGLVLTHTSHLVRRLGQFDESLATGSRGRELLREVGDRAAEASAVRSVAQTNLALGQHELVERGLAEALSLLDGSGNRRDRAQVLYSMGEMHLRRDSHDAAIEAFGQVLEIVTELRDRVGEAHARHGVGACHLEQGRPDLAEVEFDRALTIAREACLRFVEARVLCDLGDLSRSQGDPVAAVRRFLAAGELWQALKAPLWEARALRSLGDALDAAGDQAGAATARSRAHELFVELGAPEAD